jgi:hypothetical protein
MQIEEEVKIEVLVVEVDVELEEIEVEETLVSVVDRVLHTRNNNINTAKTKLLRNFNSYTPIKIQVNNQNQTPLTNFHVLESSAKYVKNITTLP